MVSACSDFITDRYVPPQTHNVSVDVPQEPLLPDDMQAEFPPESVGPLYQSQPSMCLEKKICVGFSEN